MSQATRKQPKSSKASSAAVLTLPEAARFLRLPPKTVERLVEEQGLPGRRIGREWRFLRSAIERWLAQNAAAADSTLSQAGIFADDPDFPEFMRQVAENRRRYNDVSVAAIPPQ